MLIRTAYRLVPDPSPNRSRGPLPCGALLYA
jgi:hypothetical protein